MQKWEVLDWWGYITLPDRQRADTAAVQQWVGEHGLADVRLWGGNFSLIARDAGTRTLALIVDACATVPLHWTTDPVFAHPDVEAVRDTKGAVTVNREFVEASLHPGRAPTDQTPFRDIHAVPPGCVVFVRPDGSHRTWHYFQPASLRPHPMSPDRAVDLMRRIESMRSSLQRRAMDCVGALSILSAGHSVTGGGAVVGAHAVTP